MTNLFNSMNDKSRISKVGQQYFVVKLSGSFTLSKGDYNYVVNYCTDVYCNKRGKGGHEYMMVDDLDWDTSTHKIGDVPINNMHKLKEMLKQSGLSTLAESLEPVRDDINAICKSLIEESSIVNRLFTSRLPWWHNLTEGHQQIILQEEKEMRGQKI